MKIGDRVKVQQQNQRGFPQWEETGIEGTVLQIVGGTVLLDVDGVREWRHIENNFERVVTA